jgi:hypothetical protein
MDLSLNSKRGFVNTQSFKKGREEFSYGAAAVAKLIENLKAR